MPLRRQTKRGWLPIDHAYAPFPHVPRDMLCKAAARGKHAVTGLDLEFGPIEIHLRRLRDMGLSHARAPISACIKPFIRGMSHSGGLS